MYAAYVLYKKGICDMHGLYASFLAPVVRVIVYVGYLPYLLHMWYTLLVKKVLAKSRVSTARVYGIHGIPYIPAYKTALQCCKIGLRTRGRLIRRVQRWTI
ncbi:hypothetical protein M513_10913 [Trichuris suis]|uniref:Uncharacterized protein n=1 Tax=Trichuris suis TaxID=68888 RepID=A0A085LTA3_9BILA|nr:hypothetical protein M513_10913 [Trichuris suis]